MLEKDPGNIGAREKKVDILVSREEYGIAAIMQTELVVEKGDQATKPDWNKCAELNAKAGNMGGCMNAYEKVVAMYYTTSPEASSQGADAVQDVYCEKGNFSLNCNDMMRQSTVIRLQ